MYKKFANLRECRDSFLLLDQRSIAITEFREFSGRSHLIAIQDGWQEVAEFALSWVESTVRGVALKKAA